jgi:hypothetical protein
MSRGRVSAGGMKWNFHPAPEAFFFLLSLLFLCVLYYITQPSRFQLSCCTFAPHWELYANTHTQVTLQWISGEHTRRITCFPSAPLQKCAQISSASTLGTCGRFILHIYCSWLGTHDFFVYIHGFCLLCARSISCLTKAEGKWPKVAFGRRVNLWIMDVAAGGWKKYRCMQKRRLWSLFIWQSRAALGLGYKKYWGP